MDKLDFIEGFLPSSPIFYLIYLGFFVLFGMFMIFLISKLKNEKSNSNIKKNKELTIDELIKIAKNSKSTQKDILFALMAFNENFSVLVDEKKAFELFRLVLNHKHRNKAVFDYFHGNIIPKNLKYKDELDKLEKEALNK